MKIRLGESCDLKLMAGKSPKLGKDDHKSGQGLRF